MSSEKIYTSQNKLCKIYKELQQIGVGCLDVIATIVADSEPVSVVQEDKSFMKRRGSLFDKFIHPSKAESNTFSAKVLPSAPVESPKVGLRRNSISNTSQVRMKMTELEYHQVFSILSELSNSIVLFFEKHPIVEDTGSIGTNTTLHTKIFEELKEECTSFLLYQHILAKDWSKETIVLWNKIRDLITCVVQFKVAMNKSLGKDDLHQIVLATERIIKFAPRYDQQTSELSPKKRIALNKAQMIQFIDKIVQRNPAYDNQRAISTQGQMNKTLEMIWDSSKRRLMDQRSTLSPKAKEKMKKGDFEQIIDKQQTKYTNQLWVSPEIQKEDDISKLQQSFEKIESQLPNQRYIPSPRKEKEMFLGKIQSQLDRIGGRISSQDALTRQEVKEQKFDEMNNVLDRFHPRFENQYAIPNGSVSNTPTTSPIIVKKQVQTVEHVHEQENRVPITSMKKSVTADKVYDLLKYEKHLEMSQIPSMSPLSPQDMDTVQGLNDLIDKLSNSNALDSQSANHTPKTKRTQVLGTNVVSLISKEEETEQLEEMLNKLPIRFDTQSATSSPRLLRKNLDHTKSSNIPLPIEKETMEKNVENTSTRLNNEKIPQSPKIQQNQQRGSKERKRMSSPLAN